MKAHLLIAAVCFAPPLLAQERQDFGYQWPLTLDTSATAHRVQLTPEVYRRISDPGLRDLAVFNNSGQSVPFGPIPQQTASVESGATRIQHIPFFALTDELKQGGADALRLRIERNAEGRLQSLETTIEPSTPSAASMPLLLDLRGEDDRIEAIELDFRRGDNDIRARFRISSSNDLEHWNVLIDQASVLDLSQRGFSLQRRRIALPGVISDYLMLTRLDDGKALELSSITATLRRPSQFREIEPAWLPLSHTGAEPDTAAFLYRAPGPLPVSRLNLIWPQDNQVAQVQVFSRDSEGSPWREHAAFTAFRVRDGDELIENDDIGVYPTRDREWRVQTRPVSSVAPQLHLAYRPDAYVLLAQGDGPFHLAAGSRTSGRADFPMRELLAQLGQKTGDSIALADAHIGPEAELSGGAATRAPAQTPWRQWLLWAVLFAGVGLIVVMVLRLLREAQNTSST